MISINLSKIRSDIETICRRVGRNPNEVILIGASKYSNAPQIKEAVDAGLTDIGENRIQDAIEKFQVLNALGVNVKRHMIGHLQSNKVKAAVESFDMIQSVDSVGLAQDINKHCERLHKTIEILIQVNTSQESQKSGLEIQDVMGALEEIKNLPHIRVKGFMTMAMLTEDKESIRRCFRKLSEFIQQVKPKFENHPYISLEHLSMGMSDDYALAIEEGATMIRIGRAIFL